MQIMIMPYVDANTNANLLTNEKRYTFKKSCANKTCTNQHYNRFMGTSAQVSQCITCNN